MKKLEITGETYGMLTVIRPAEKMGIHTRWLCECSCGNVKSIRTNSLRSGAVKSCGCLPYIKSKEMFTIHGKSHIEGKQGRLYRIWKNMRSRCKNKNVPCYGRYGGRGITVCEQWDSFVSFQEWALSSGYSSKLTIDRIENSEGYRPDNCKWSTVSEQSMNRRPRRSHFRTYKNGNTVFVNANTINRNE